MSDNPFAEPSDSERTIIRPRPGGARPPQAAEPPPDAAQAPPPAAAASVAVPSIGSNPLVAIAAPLLAAAIRVAGGRGGRNPDPEVLRRGMVAEMRQFERRALATGMDTRLLKAARYALCATIDDLVLSTPWGAASSWSQQSLTSIFHTEVTGGDRFFDILEQMQKDLGKNGEVVELMYLCTSLGFEGRYRVMPRGGVALGELRESVYRLIRNRRGEFERELSPHWQGIPAARRKLSRLVPLWSIPLTAVVLLALIYLGFNFALAGLSDIAFAELYNLPPRTAPVVPRTVALAPAAAPGAPAPARAPAEPSQFVARLRQFLAPEIKAGLVVVLEDPQSVTVRLTNRNMFALGEATLSASYPPLIARIGEALQDEQGHVTVNGYTDNQPIHTARFPSNFHLSQARAETVAGLIAAKLTDKTRVTATGKADADPLAPNDTPEGRQQNRRTEIVLGRTATSP